MTGKTVNLTPAQKRNLIEEIFKRRPLTETIDQWPQKKFIERIKFTFRRKETSFAFLSGELFRAHLRWKLGSYAALFDALEICREFELPAPNWLAETTTQGYAAALLDGVPILPHGGRQRRLEQKRLQEQKHFQVFFAIKKFQMWPSFKADPKSYDSRAFYPKEVRHLTKDDILKLKTNRKIYAKIEELLPNNGPSNSMHTVEKTLTIGKRAELAALDLKKIDGANASYLVWDIPFVRSSTAKSLKTLYNQ